MSDTVSQDSSGTVYLAPSMASKMAKNDHVIVTKADIDGVDVKWSDVDRTELTDSTSKIPSSKIAYDISSKLDNIETTVFQHHDGIHTLNENTHTISTDLNEHIHAADSRISTLSSGLTILSTELSGFFNHTAVKFIGVSETDPETGIVTLNGVRYVISSDFDESNNGNIIYYRKSITNHCQTHIPEGREDQYHQSDSNEDVAAIRMIYAYIYANGVLDDYGQIQLSGDRDDEDATISGGFQKIGYGFYENLSTLIHDEDVCDDAAIQKHKISGLVDDLSALYRRDDTISASVDYISSVVSSKSLSIDDIYDRYATKTYVDDNIGDLSTTIDNHFPTKEILQLSVSQLITNYDTQDRALDRKIDSVNQELTSLITGKFVSNNRVLTAANSYADEINKNTHPIDANYAISLINQRVLTSNVQTSLANLTSTSKVPAMKVLTDLSASLIATISNLSAQILNSCEPRIGSLQYVFTVDRTTFGDINPSSPNFCGWVFANGTTITCRANEFIAAKKAFGYYASNTSFQVPLINAYMKPSNTSGSTTVPSRYPLADGVMSIPSHEHNIDVSIQKAGTSSSTLNIAVNIPRGSGTNANGQFAHQGSGTQHGNVTARTSIDLSQLNFTGAAKVLSTIAIPNGNGMPQKDAWPEPQHYSIPLLIYIGKRN